MEYWAEVQGWLLWLWSQWQVQALVAHVLVNLVVAVAASIRTGEFVLAKTGEFLWKKLLPLVLVYGAFATGGEAIGQSGVATATWATIFVVLLGDLADNLKKLGLPIPEALTKARL